MEDRAQARGRPSVAAREATLPALNCLSIGSILQVSAWRRIIDPAPNPKKVEEGETHGANDHAADRYGGFRDTKT
jgi:hypothetical protein